MNEAHSVAELTACGLRCEDFILDMTNAGQITVPEGERLHAMFDAALEAKIQDFIPILSAVPWYQE
jgi:hypothetical protein